MRQSGSGQSAASVEQNRRFFAGERYAGHAARLDSHARIREALTAELRGTKRLLDIGNGGVFEYDTSVVGSIVAVDLFLGDAPPSELPANVTARRGDALALRESSAHYDAVIEAFLFHHLVGERPADMISNVRLALKNAADVMKDGGRLIVAESCVPRWFFGLERLLFRPLNALARTPLLGGHPATFQIPSEMLLRLIRERFDVQRAYRISLGRWVTQFGRRWPTVLTPVRAYVVVATKVSAA
jgi:SAM-dependent methyltransferase